MFTDVFHSPAPNSAASDADEMDCVLMAGTPETGGPLDRLPSNATITTLSPAPSSFCLVEYPPRFRSVVIQSWSAFYSMDETGEMTQETTVELFFRIQALK